VRREKAIKRQKSITAVLEISSETHNRVQETIRQLDRLDSTK